MAESINIADVVSYQAYVRRFGATIMSKAYLGFNTQRFVKNMPGVKGKVVLNKMQPNGDVVRGFDGVFQGYASQKIVPIVYEVNDFKSEFMIKPWELRYSYLGDLASQGFDPVEFPIQAKFFMEHAAKMAEEIEIAIWEGVRDGGADADAPIIQKLDGFGKRAATAIGAGNEVVVSGEINETNIIPVLREMYDKVDKRFKNQRLQCFISINHQQQYRIARGVTLQNITDDWTRDNFNTGNMDIIWVGGLANNKIMITPADNLTYIYDGAGDMSKWYLDRDHYHIEGSVVGAAGTQIDWTDNGYLILNDQWV